MATDKTYTDNAYISAHEELVEKLKELRKKYNGYFIISDDISKHHETYKKALTDPCEKSARIFLSGSILDAVSKWHISTPNPYQKEAKGCVAQQLNYTCMLDTLYHEAAHAIGSGTL